MEDTLQEIKKLYGDMAIYLVSQFPKQELDVISTGSLLLDNAIGVGGIPRGRITEIFGIDGVGKTTVCQHLVANAQKAGLNCAFIDVENALDLSYMEMCGVDLDSLYLSQPNFAEEALGIADMLIKDGNFGLVVLDSVAALTPQKEVDEPEFKDRNITGMQRAKLLNVFFRRAANHIRENNVSVVFTNQMRDNVGSFFGGFVQPGGHGLKHYASVRIRLNRKKAGQVKVGKEVVGQDIEFIVIKNRVGNPYKTSKFTILFGYGIDRETDILTCAEELGIVHKRGAFYVLDGEVIGQGKAKANDMEIRCRGILK